MEGVESMGVIELPTKEAPPDPKSQPANRCFLAEANELGFSAWETWVREHCDKAQVNGPILADIGGKPYIFGHAQAPWFLHEQWRVGVGIEIAAQMDARAQIAANAPGVAVAQAGSIPDGPQAQPRRRR